MPKIHLANNDGFVLVDKEDYQKLKNFRWRLHSNGYAVTNQSTLMHRIIMNPPKGLVVDHINRNKLDNRRSNLRNVSHTINHLNSRVRSKAGYKGVYYNKEKKKYQAQLHIRGKNYYLGIYDNPIDANKAYQKAVYAKV